MSSKKKTTEEKIRVMQAFVDGKDVKCTFDFGNHICNISGGEMVWDWCRKDYDIAEEIPVKPSINWDHVSDKYNYLHMDKSGSFWLSTNKPIGTEYLYNLTGYSIYGNNFASFKEGENCKSIDSLVCRPGFEE